MKKFFQISVVVVLTLTLATTAFTVTGTRSELAEVTVCPLVGWNTSPQALTDTSITICPISPVILPPDFTPMVGWNT